MDIISIVIVVLALFVGLFAGIFVKKNEIERLNAEKSALQEKNDELTKNIQKLSEEAVSDKTKLKMLTELQELVKKDFTEIANNVIKEEQSDLREQNREALEEKLKPFRENFEQFKEKIEDFNKKGEINTTTIKERVDSLIKESLSIKTTANDLTNAIRANSQTRGEFGEMILENLLKQAGLINKRDDEEKGNYVTQQTFRDITAPEERPRPDAVLFLPENKSIIIDSKCPLNNFIEFSNSQNEEEKNAQLKMFYRAVSDMINELSNKYNALEGLHTPEFKLMFIPLESCASYIYSNQEITRQALSQNIIIVCPSTLFATLKLIRRVWTQKNQSEHLESILKTATGAYTKLVTFLENLKGVQKSFNTTAKAFDAAFATAEGKGGLIKQIAELEKLGIQPKKKIDEKYLTETEELTEISES